MANLAKIFTGMDNGPEQIMNDLNALNSDLTNVSGVANSAFEVSSFIGIKNPNLNNLGQGVHEIGFWSGDKVPGNNGWPATMVGWDNFFGGLIAMGDPAGIGQQIMIASGFGIAFRTHSGDLWTDWYQLTSTDAK
ncbi:hypothetical protein PS376_03140 [Limosilactobacillus pontis]|uniref:hypothetical protein n=1 Tax=Limosilactobacillus pontis TaxID=35787 RepID=UPI002F26595E